MSIANQLSTLDFIVFSTVAVAFGLILWLAKFRKKSGIMEYLAMGRALTLPAFVITLVSSWYGSVVGVTQIAYKYGIYNFFAMGFFWYLSALIFAFFLASKFSKSQALSLPAYMGSIHGPVAEKILLTLLFIKTLPIPYIMAFSMILASLFGWQDSTALIAAFLVALVMSLRSSLKSVMIIDFIQFITIFSGLSITLYFCLSQLGGMEYLKANLPAAHLTVTGGNDIQKLILWFMVALSTTVLSPIFHQRCFAARTPQVAKFGIIISIVFWVISDILTTLGGLYARAYLGDGHDAHAYLELAAEILPAGLVGYMIAAMLITAISALDSYLFAAKSLVVNYYHGRNITLPKATYLLLGFFIVTTSTLIAANLAGDLEKAWLLFESAFIASLLFPVLVSIYSKNFLSPRQFNAIVVGVFIISLILEYYYLSNQSSASLSIMCASGIIVGLCAVFRLRTKFSS